MNRSWLFWLGVVLIGAGTLLSQLDIGSPWTGNVLQVIGFSLVLWTLVRRGGT